MPWLYMLPILNVSDQSTNHYRMILNSCSQDSKSKSSGHAKGGRDGP